MSIQAVDESREAKAAREKMTIYEEAPGLYSVSTQSGSEYLVDARDVACQCPDFEYRSHDIGACKHIIRCRMTLGIDDIPTDVDPDPLLLTQREAMGDE